jgi:alkyl hydroperoxide reductase subunit AhpF
MNHDGSAYQSTRKAIEAAEDRGFDSGREIGRAEGMEARAALDVAFLVAAGFADAAAALREARIVEDNGE